MKIKPRINPEASGPSSLNRRPVNRRKPGLNSRRIAQTISIPLVASVACGEPNKPSPAPPTSPPSRPDAAEKSEPQAKVSPWKQTGTTSNGLPVFQAENVPTVGPFDDVVFGPNGIEVKPRPPKVIFDRARQMIKSDPRLALPYIMLLDYYNTEEGAKHEEEIQTIFQHGFDEHNAPIAAHGLCELGVKDREETENAFRLRRDNNLDDPHSWYDYAHFVDASGDNQRAIIILKEGMRTVPSPPKEKHAMSQVFDLYRLLLGMNKDRDDNLQALDLGIQRHLKENSIFSETLENLKLMYIATPDNQLPIPGRKPQIEIVPPKKPIRPEKTPVQI